MYGLTSAVHDLVDCFELVVLLLDHVPPCGAEGSEEQGEEVEEQPKDEDGGEVVDEFAREGNRMMEWYLLIQDMWSLKVW